MIESQLRSADLTVREFGILLVAKTNKNLNQQKLGAMLGLDRTTMMRLADQLEKSGYITRNRSEQDRRVYMISLTPLATSLLTTSKKSVEAVEREFLTILSADEVEAFEIILTKLANHWVFNHEK